MRTSSPLVQASAPSVRKPALKRRKLNNTTDPGCQSNRPLTDNSNVALTPNTSSLSLCAKLSCSTCHRALSTAIRPGVAGLSMCSRCSAPTCAICARTCTSYTCLSSVPPTPALTRSPSPSTHAGSPVSPKRTALTLSSAPMGRDGSLAPPSPFVHCTKRKKAPIDKEDVDADTDVDGRAARGHGLMSLHDSARDSAEFTVVSGCGRVVCRTCCVESMSNDGKLCVDCFALV